MTRDTAPRLVPLRTALKVLGGHHPIKLGIVEAFPGVFDLKAIHAALDRKAGLEVVVSGDTRLTGPANDDTDVDEHTQIAKRIADRAPRRP